MNGATAMPNRPTGGTKDEIYMCTCQLSSVPIRTYEVCSGVCFNDIALKSIPGWYSFEKECLFEPGNFWLKMLNLIGVPRVKWQSSVRWYSNGSLTSPLVILWSMDSLWSSLLDCSYSHPRSFNRAETEVSDLSCWYGTFFTSLAALHCHFKFIRVFLLVWIPDVWVIFKLRTTALFPPVFGTHVVCNSLYQCTHTVEHY